MLLGLRSPRPSFGLVCGSGPSRADLFLSHAILHRFGYKSHDMTTSLYTTVLTPDPARLSPKVLTVPFILYYASEYPMRVVNALPLPNVLELMGGSSGGGGPPGFCTIQTRGNVRDQGVHQLLLIAGFLSGREIKCNDKDGFAVIGDIGAVASSAVVVTYMQLDPNYPVDKTDPQDIERYIMSLGWAPIPLIEYRTPDMIINAIQSQVPGGL
jgi:hypothetical protein